jgi:wyosine [tRNA(Phe)-imidazoG37] synthetase (radical SAM superfamily)
MDLIHEEVQEKITQTEKTGRTIDFLTLVPDGEPTLDANLGQILAGLRSFGIPLAVISNAALIDDKEVQDELMLADWVSLKVDAVNEPAWRQVNRPFGRLALNAILSGILEFRKRFQGELVTETMLISGVNDARSEILDLADYLLELQPYKSYISIPTRPPAESWVRVPHAEALQEILDILSKKVSFIDLLFDPEGSDFLSTNDLKTDILSIIAVHPLREEALRKMVTRSDEEWSVVEALVDLGKMVCLEYRGEKYYLPGSRSK